MITYLKKFKNYIRIKNILLLCLVLGFLTTSNHFRFTFKETFNPEKRSIPIYSVDIKENNISITFDCAWGSDDIPQMIDILNKHEIKATFFIVGEWAKKYPDKVKLIYENGHDIGNHSYSHPKMSLLDETKIKEEILKCEDVFKEIISSPSSLFRAPYGDYSDGVVDTAKKINYDTIQWDVDSLDWKPYITKDEIIDRVLNNVKKGSIILFHNDTRHTISILDEVIIGLKNRGFKFKPVSELIFKDKFEIDNTGKQKMIH